MSVEEVIEQIYEMNSSKLPGPSGIYPGDLKEFEDEIAELLSSWKLPLRWRYGSWWLGQFFTKILIGDPDRPVILIFGS